MDNTISGIQRSISDLQTKYTEIKTTSDIYKKDLSDTNQKISSLRIKTLQQVSILLQSMSVKHRDIARKRLEELGTVALQYSMGSEYNLIIEMSDTKTKTEIYIYNSVTKFKTKPTDANGGGIIDILSMAMRFVVMVSTQKYNIDGPMILDEPFKMLSSEFVPKMVDFIKKISDDFDCQFIIVTHNPYLAASCDQIVSVKLDDNGVSHAEDLVNG